MKKKQEKFVNVPPSFEQTSLTNKKQQTIIINSSYLMKQKFLQQNLKYLKQVKDFLCEFKHELNFKNKQDEQIDQRMLNIDKKLKLQNFKTKQIIQNLQQRIIQNKSKYQIQEEDKLLTSNYQKKLQQISQILIRYQQNVQRTETLKKNLSANEQNTFYKSHNSLNNYFSIESYNSSIIQNLSLKNRITQRFMYYIKLKNQKKQICKKKNLVEEQLKLNNFSKIKQIKANKQFQEYQFKTNYKKFKILQGLKLRRTQSLHQKCFLTKCQNNQVNLNKAIFKMQKLTGENSQCDNKNQLQKQALIQNRKKNSFLINWFVNKCIKQSLYKIKSKNQILQHKIDKLKLGIQETEKTILIKKLKEDIHQQDQLMFQIQETDNFQQDNKKIMLVLLQADKFNSHFQIRQTSLPFSQKLKKIRQTQKDYISKQWPDENQKITNIKQFIFKYQRLRKVKSLSYIDIIDLNLLQKNSSIEKMREKLKKKKNVKKGLKIMVKQKSFKQEHLQKKINQDANLTVSSSSQNNANRSSQTQKKTYK